MKSIKNILTLLFISFLSFSTFAGNGSEIIVIGNTGPDYYLVDYNTDWIASMNRQQYEQWLASERQRQSAHLAQQERGRRISICELDVAAEETRNVFKANVSHQNNMYKCGDLLNGLSVTLQFRGAAGFSFSSSSQYQHCTVMAQPYLATEKSGYVAEASAKRRDCHINN